MRPLPPLLTIKEAAKLLRFGRTTVYEMAREYRSTNGRSGLPVIKIRGRLRVPREEFEQRFGLTTRSMPRESDDSDVRENPDDDPGQRN